MEIKKVNLNRLNLNSEYIEGKQDFKLILNQARLLKTTEWKSPWFYGAFGLSSIAFATIFVHDFETKKLTHDLKATQKSTENSTNFNSSCFYFSVDQKLKKS